MIGRYRRLAAEAAENAGRVLVASAELAAQVRSQFGDLEERVTVVPALGEATHRPSNTLLAELVEIYTHVLDERWGRR